MKISELANKSKVPKETIHYYIRAGLLPKPTKLGSNQADYDESFVERIRLIKELQNDFFFPLPTIKKIMWENRSAKKLALLKLRSEYFRPVEQYLGTGVEGVEDFLGATKLSEEWLRRLQDWGLVSRQEVEGREVFSQDDVIIAKVVVDMYRLGLKPEANFDTEVLKEAAWRFREIVKLNQMNFRRATAEGFSPEERADLAAKAQEIMGVFFYHLYRKFTQEESRAAASGQEERT